MEQNCIEQVFFHMEQDLLCNKMVLQRRINLSNHLLFAVKSDEETRNQNF